MPNITTTIEDTSPVIIYSNGWQIGSSTNDVFVERYSGSSYMRTNVSRASASFTFYGNGVQLFGAKRQNFSRYQVSIDSMVYPIRDASVSDPQGMFQTSLFSTIALSLGYHTVRLTNIDQAPLDLDFVTWQTPVGSDYDTITVVTTQDSESSFDYTPPSQWSASVPNPGMFSGGSGHVTYTASASVRFTFKGNSPLGHLPIPDHTVQEVPYNYLVPLGLIQLLFQASNLVAGDHSLSIRSEAGTNSSVYFAIDYAQVFTPSSWNASGRSKLSVGQIVGIVVGSVCGLLLLGLLILVIRSKRGQYLLLRKKQEDRRSDSGLVIEPFSDLQTPPATTPLYDTQAFTPQNLKGQPSHGTMVQRYSQPDQPLTASSFSGEHLYIQQASPFPWSPVHASTQPAQPPARTPHIMDEKRRLEPPSDEPAPEMAQMSTSVPPIISGPAVEEFPPVYLK